MQLLEAKRQVLLEEIMELHKDFEKQIDSFSLDNFFIYSTLSEGYSFLSNEMVNHIEAQIQKKGIQDAINDPSILNDAGVELYGMPYVKDSQGQYNFVMPAISIDSDSYLNAIHKASEVYRKLISPVFDSEYIAFDNPVIVNFSNRIELTNKDFKDDVNYLNLAINILTIFITQIFVKGIINEQQAIN